MKKLLILSALIVSGAAAFAQTSNLTVTVGDVRTIQVTAGGTAGIGISTVADYAAVASAAGKDADAVTAIKVISRGGYKVKASLPSSLLHNGAPTANQSGIVDIPGDALRLKVTAAPVKSGTNEQTPEYIGTNTSFPVTGGDIADLVKTTSGTSNNGGTLGTTFNVNYNLGNYADVVNLAGGAFAATITYTIEAN